MTQTFPCPNCGSPVVAVERREVANDELPFLRPLFCSIAEDKRVCCSHIGEAKPQGFDVRSPAEQEAACWRIIEPRLLAGAHLHQYVIPGRSPYCARFGQGREHFGATRLDALAQLAHAIELGIYD